MRLKRLICLWLLTSLFGYVSLSANEEKLKVVATHAILGEWVQHIGGDVISLTILVGPEVDAHTFEPLPDQAVALQKADLLIENGLGLEPWLNKLYTASESNAMRFVIANELPLKSQDPHLWLAVNQALLAVDAIQTALTQAMPKHADTFYNNAARYIGELKELEEWIFESVAKIPHSKRNLLTYHDNLFYFAKRYGFADCGSILGTTSTDSPDPSAKQFASLLDRIQQLSIAAIFSDAMSSQQLPNQLAHEAGLPAPVPLYIDNLGKPGSNVDSYIKLMRYNVSNITEALSL